ncbi:DNA-processing protein DprA [Thermophilibacter provencensis]|uniref:DNA-protecting protein DprA n=1 Tax=Thermophilibacter provencensis TaxID=1852386 RepID=A0ABT7V4N3_9ACTN|nr:DNA-protecting protein DprA [Thermophilibacter provencensis]MDM8270951.1 DNA-protecting protein DprA [Thermophilibacter provencensis]
MSDVLRGDRWEIARGEEGYPPTLEDLESPPELIFGVGQREALLGPALAVVGARRATPYGLSIAEMAARVAAECGVTVISGGAMGCDHAAGYGALRAGGRTVVVSGCGADVVYPSSSRDVFEGAVSSGGAVISAQGWGSGPRRWAFPKRNALIAALSQVLVVTEAGVRSGTMSTADAAVELGRTVYAIPGSIFSPNSAGTNRLLSEGARVIPDEQSLALAISLDFGVARFSEARGRLALGPIMSALLASPSRPDELAARLGESVLTILKTLTEFESRRVVERLPDGRYSPTREYLMGLGDGS